MKYNHGNNNPILDAYKTFEWKSTALTRMQARWYLALLAISILLCNASTVLAVDTDGDGVDDDLDTFPFDSSQQLDSDFDGFGDSPVGNNSDDCPLEYGTSLTDNLGCVDDDGDGIRNADDQFPFDDQQWLDRDGDGFGDNLVGENGDACPDEPNNGNHGCAKVQQAAAEKLQGEAGTPIFNLAILISIVVGIIVGIKLPKVSDAENMWQQEEDKSENIWQQEDDKPLLSILFGVLLLTSLIPALALLTDVAADGTGADGVEIWFDDNHTYLAWWSIDGDEMTDGFTVTYEVETNETDDVELRVQANITIQAEPEHSINERTEIIFYHTNISNSTPDAEVEIPITPWAVGNYTAELWVQRIIGGSMYDGELSEDFDNQTLYMEQMENYPIMQGVVEGDLIDGSQCTFQVEINDKVGEDWDKNGSWEVISFAGILIEGSSPPKYDCQAAGANIHVFEFKYTSYFGDISTVSFSINIILQPEDGDYCDAGDERDDWGFCVYDGMSEISAILHFDTDLTSDTALNLTAVIAATDLTTGSMYDIDYYLYLQEDGFVNPESSLDVGYIEFTATDGERDFWNEWSLSGTEIDDDEIVEVDRGETYCLRVQLYQFMSEGEMNPEAVDVSCDTIPLDEDGNNSTGEGNNSTGEENNSTGGGEDPLGAPPLIPVDVSFSSEIFILSEANECWFNLSVNEWTNTSVIVIEGSPIAGIHNDSNMTIDCSNWPVGVHHLKLNSSAGNGQHQVALFSLIIEDEELVVLANNVQLVDALESASFGSVLATLVGLCVGIMAAVAIVVGVVYSRMNRVVSIDIEEGAGVMLNFFQNSKRRE